MQLFLTIVTVLTYYNYFIYIFKKMCHTTWLYITHSVHNQAHYLVVKCGEKNLQ